MITTRHRLVLEPTLHDDIIKQKHNYNKTFRPRQMKERERQMDLHAYNLQNLLRA